MSIVRRLSLSGSDVILFESNERLKIPMDSNGLALISDTARFLHEIVEGK